MHAWYSARSLPPRAHVHLDEPAAAAFAAAGWTTYDPTLLMLGGVSKVLRRLGRPDVEVSALPLVDEGWLASDERAARYGDPARQVLEAGEVTFATVRDEAGNVLARGRGAFHGDWVGVSSLWTREDARRTGLGSAVLRPYWSGVPSAERRRPTCRWSSRTPSAQELYSRQGYEVHHRYDYLVAGSRRRDLRIVHLRHPDVRVAPRPARLRTQLDRRTPSRRCRDPRTGTLPPISVSTGRSVSSGASAWAGPAPSMNGTATPLSPSVANRSRNSLSNPV